MVHEQKSSHFILLGLYSKRPASAPPTHWIRAYHKVSFFIGIFSPLFDGYFLTCDSSKTALFFSQSMTTPRVTMPDPELEEVSIQKLKSGEDIEEELEDTIDPNPQ